MWDLQICQVVDNLNDDPAYSSVGVRKASDFLHDTSQKLQVKEDFIVASESLNGRNHVLWNRRIPIGHCFDLETTPYIYFELPGDLSARGPPASICVTAISCTRCQRPSPGRQIERFLYVGGLGIDKTSPKLSFCHFRLPN